MKKIFLLSSMILGISLSADVSTLYKPCSGCHGLKGEKIAMVNKSKIINKMSKEDFIASMKGYKAGTYGGPLKGLMKGQVMRLSDQDIKDLADYIVK